MAATKKALAAKAAKEKGQQVSRAEFDALTGSVGELVDLIKSGALGAKPAAETPEQVAVTKAAPNKYTVNPEWEDLAREIIGAAVDHTEIEYVKGGGMKFTVVIKDEMSNAPKDYLERHKVDRRSKEVGQEGEAGVRIWCTQIRDNLKKPRPVSVD